MRMRAYSMRWQRIRAWLPAGSRSRPHVLVPKCIQAPKLSSANLNPRAQATQATQSRPEHRLAHAGGPSACHTDTATQYCTALRTEYCVPRALRSAETFEGSWWRGPENGPRRIRSGWPSSRYMVRLRPSESPASLALDSCGPSR